MAIYAHLWIQRFSVCYIRCSDTQTHVYQRAYAATGAGEEMSRVRKAAGNSFKMQY